MPLPLASQHYHLHLSVTAAVIVALPPPLVATIISRLGQPSLTSLTSRRPKWHNFERKSFKIALKIAFPKKILLNVQPGAAKIAPSSIVKSLY
jgi:hypothetical protein